MGAPRTKADFAMDNAPNYLGMNANVSVLGEVNDFAQRHSISRQSKKILVSRQMNLYFKLNCTLDQKHILELTNHHI